MLRKNSFWSAGEGAVSIYVTLIIVPVFIFNAIMIDYLRIGQAGTVMEDAVKASARSTMSAYDETLQQYGLFGQGLGSEESKNLFASVVESNLAMNDEPGYFHYSEPSLIADSVNVQNLYTLADQVELKRQILQAMKYKAPVEFALNITDKLQKTNVSDQLKETAHFAELSEETQAYLEQREDRLDQAWDAVSDLREQLREYHEYYSDKLERLNELAGKIGLHTMTEMTGSLKGIQSQLYELAEQMSGLNNALTGVNRSMIAVAMSGAGSGSALIALINQKNRLTEAISDMQGRISQLNQEKGQLQELLEQIVEYTRIVAEIKSRIIEDDDQVLAAQQEIERSIDEAKSLNSQIRELMAQKSAGEANETKSLKADKVFSRIVLGDDYFHRYQTGYSEATSVFHGFRQRLEQASMFLDDPFQRLVDDNERYYSEMNRFHQSFHSEEQARKANRLEINRRKKEAKGQLQTTLDKVKQAVAGCPEGSGKEAYSVLQGGGNEPGLYRKYADYNDIAETNDTELPVIDSEKSGLAAIGMGRKLMEMIVKARDEMYVNEYALTSFNYRTEEKMRELTGASASSGLPLPEDHVLQQQEVEFILYGFYSCEANYAAAYGEMFALRLAVRTMEALMEPKNELLNIGSPALVLLAAMAEGAANAYEDMNKLLVGENVPITKKLTSSVSMNYKDYLRLFLFLHSSDDRMLSRVQALLELNTGLDLSGYTTYLQGTAAASVKLWFMPGLLDMFHNIGLLDCRVRGNRCEITRTAVFAY